MHLDPNVLDGYRVLFVVGHSEYWSFEAMDAVSRFLDRGGNAVVLSGNTAFWRVSYSADATVIECRKGDAPGTQVRADRRGEMWHSHDRRRGGMARECGFPAWRLFGLEYFSLVGVGVPGVGPYKVRNAGHFLFRSPNDLKLRDGDTIGGTPGRPLPQPIGHEGDARVSTIAKFLVEPPPQGGAQPIEDPAGITPAGRWLCGLAEDRLRLGLLPAAGPARQGSADLRRGRDDLLGAARWRSRLPRRIDQRRLDPARDAKWAGLMQNVLHHFGVKRGAENGPGD